MPLLSEVAELIMGQSPPSSSYNENGEGLPFFQGKVDFGFLHPIPRKYCTDPKKISEKGDILISVRAPVGPTNICSLQSCIGRGLAVIRPKDVDGMFLYFLLKDMESHIASLGTGSTFKSINKSQLSNLSVNTDIFTRPEQRRIAAVLSAVQRAIEQQEELIARTTELKKALMHKLFTEGTRGEPQKETEIGPVPESWDVVNLGILFSLSPNNGLYKPKSLYGEGTLILRIDDFSNDGDIVTNAGNRIQADDDDLQRYGLSKDDIVINRVNSLSHLGKSALIGDLREPMLFESNMMRFRVDEEKILAEYAFRFLNSPLCKKQILGCAKRAVAQSSINQGDVRNISVPLPKLEEQREVVELLTDTVMKIHAHNQFQSTLQDLFHTLLHQLMTAEVRVGDVDLSELREIGIVVD